MKLDRRTFLTLGTGAFLVATLPGGRTVLVRRRIPVMGTVAEFAVVHRSRGAAHRAIDAACAELRFVDRTMTRFAESDLQRLERGLPVRPATRTVLAAARRWQEASDGRFDPRVNGSFDFGGIAKGYGVDRAVAALRAHGVEHALVNAGGDLFALGRSHDGDAWRIGVRDPRGGVSATIPVTDRAVATSGDYEQPGHLIDPRTGTPVETDRRSLTVIAATCMHADAAATALFGRPQLEVLHTIDPTGELAS